MSYRRKYARVARWYELLEKPLDRFFCPLRKEALSFARGKVLEIGIGTGKTLKYYPRNVELYAVDGTPEMLKIAEEKAEKLGITAKFSVMEAENLKLSSESFDTVVSSFVFCTVENPKKAMKEIRRVLKPDGRAIFIEHTRSDSKLINLFFLLPMKLILYPILGDDTLRNTHELIREFFDVELEESYYKGIVRLIVARKKGRDYITQHS